MTPIESLLGFARRADRLESLPRTGWLFGGVVAPESVSSHIYQTSLIALWLAEELQADVERVLRIALLHDVGEAILTDLPRPTKEFVGRETMIKAERSAVEHVLVGMPTTWGDAYEEYENAATLEARIVKAADRIQMLVKASIYDAQNRGDVGRFFEIPDHDFGIPIVGEILLEIREMRARGAWAARDLD